MPFCQHCGKEVSAGTSFCPSCGKPIAGAQAPPAHAPPQPAVAGPRPNLATEGDRIVAVIIDSIIVLIFFLVIFIPLTFIVGFFTFGFAFLFFGPALLLSWLLWSLYFTFFESTSGQTPGKQIMRIRVVDETTLRHLDFGRSLVRNILRIIDWLPFFYLIGFILVVTNQNKQRIGDMAARSLVIKA